MKIVFVTGNQNKLKEIRALLKDSSYELVSSKEMGFTEDIPETGSTFFENAWLKADAVCFPGCIVMADDSGFEIDAMDKKPGVYSARFLGEETPYEEKFRAIFSALENVPDEKRTCRFVSVIAVKFPDGTKKTAVGSAEGYVTRAPKGDMGFGYDPIFYVPEFSKTMAEMTMEEKNQISHRGKALREAAAYLRAYTENRE